MISATLGWRDVGCKADFQLSLNKVKVGGGAGHVSRTWFGRWVAVSTFRKFKQHHSQGKFQESHRVVQHKPYQKPESKKEAPNPEPDRFAADPP